MKTAILAFPGSNRERDAGMAIQHVTGTAPEYVWHGETSLPKVDLVIVPGGFSYGDYLRAGAMAARSPVIRAVVDRARDGGPTLGICNGFQVLCECGLLPGALLRNADLKFVCRFVDLRVASTTGAFTTRLTEGQTLRVPVAHHDGNYFADDATLDRLEGEGRVTFRYADTGGRATGIFNPNGSARDIAGIQDESGRILGLMPHPENAIHVRHGGTDGLAFFRSVMESMP